LRESVCNFGTETAVFLFSGKQANPADNSELDIQITPKTEEGHGTLLDAAITFGRQHMHDQRSLNDLVSGEHPEAAELCPTAATIPALSEGASDLIRPPDCAFAAGSSSPSRGICVGTEGAN
jgi:hypothetical protein